MRKTLRDGRGGGGGGGQTRRGEAMRKGQQEATEAEIVVRLKEKMLQKVSESRTARVTKKDGDKKRKTTVTYGEDKADGHASHQYGSN